MSNMKKTIRTAAAVGVALALALGTCITAFAADAPAKEIHIRTAADLSEFAKKCSLDSWSDGKHVILDSDISLAGMDFNPIPIFNGLFDGCGHEISDLKLTAPMSPCGLFLETGKDAEIRLLTVSGTINPSGDDSQVGGIIGVNRGTVNACIFNGSVNGKSCVGAVAGQNESTGVITRCRVSGTVFGLGQAGGIVGQNNGSVLDCENRSFINTQSIDPSLQPDKLDTSSLLNLFGSITSENADITANIGGIAGGNDGFVELCSNNGTVGYLHLGCNVGGIAGRSGGHISGCTNTGDVFGRRNAGGIVGRAEPLVEVTKARDLLAGLGYRMQSLNKSIDTAIKDAGDGSEDLVKKLKGMRTSLDPVCRALLEIDPADPSALSQVRSAVESALGSISAELKNISSGLGSDSDLLKDDLEDVEEEMGKLSGAAIQALTLLSGGDKTDDIIADDSENSAETIVLGKVSENTNEGSVYADSNVGGIAGIITVEDEPDWNNLAGGDSGKLVQNRYSLRCVLADCINRGEIIAKRECAGGICGKMDFGLTTRSQNYGPISLEDGSYAGGVCGLSYGTVKNCCVKCTLTGSKYIGGILGNGYDARNNEERSSRTEGCRSLVRIIDRPEFAAAISGGGAGDYKDNLFVSDEYAGLDRRSISGTAEPVDFDTFAGSKNVPEECLSFTLTFVVDGETVKTVPFSYGESFSRSVFPSVEERDGLYPVWDRTDLTRLTFDTVVTAEYRTDKTVLRSELTREDGRPAVYADGQFQEGDIMTVRQLRIDEEDVEAFRIPGHETLREQLLALLSGGGSDGEVNTSVAEKLLLSVPDDGQTEHMIRYLPPDGNTDHGRIFLLTESGWERLETETFGSYLTFTLSGTSAQIALVQTIRYRWIAEAGAVVILIIFSGIILTAHWVKKLRRQPKKQKVTLKERLKNPVFRRRMTVTVPTLCLIAVLAAAGIYLLSDRLGAGMEAYKLIKDFSEEETAVRAEILIKTDDREIPASTVMRRVNHNGRMITCADKFGIPLYLSDGRVYLENGRAFRVASRLDQSAAMELAGQIFSGGQIKKVKKENDTVYRAVVQNATADRVISVFLGTEYQGLIHVKELTVELTATDRKVKQLSVVGQGVTEKGSEIGLTATFVTEPMAERPAIPQNVLQAMAEDNDVTEILTEDMLSLFSAWMKFDDAENLTAEISLNAEGGPLSVSTDCSYFRTKVNGTYLHCLSTPIMTMYFTDHAACTEDGSSLQGTENQPRDAARIISAARELSLEGRYSCEHNGDTRIFNISLDPEASEKLAETVMPQLREMHLTYGDNTVGIRVTNGRIENIEFRCRGGIKIVNRQTEADINVTVQFTEEDLHEIPQAVIDALINGVIKPDTPTFEEQATIVNVYK